MPTYTTSINIDIPEPDLTQKLDVSVTATRESVEKINEYLSRVEAALAKGKPYPDEFDFLDSFDEIERLPFTTVQDFKIVIDSMPIEQAGYALSLVGAINTAFPEIGIEGKCYNITPVFGKRNIYNLNAPRGEKTLEIVQKYEDAMPGDTRVPEPTALDAEGMPVNPTKVAEHPEGSNNGAKLVSMNMDGEPDYILPNDRFNPMALLWLLQNELLDIYIDWSFGKHTVIRFSYTDGTEEKAQSFVEQRNEIGQSPFALMNYLSEDEYGYPGEWVHSKLGSESNFPNGDIDITSMLYLCSLGMWYIQELQPSEYEVTVDQRLVKGVPDACTLIARLLWRMRQYAEIGGAFTITFRQKHIDRLDEHIAEFDGIAFGAQELAESKVMVIEDEPTPDPNNGQERPFSGGISRASSLWAGSTDRRNVDDRGLFIRKLKEEMHSFPKTVPMNGGLFEGEAASERMRLLPGDLVTLASIWNAKGATGISGDIVGIKAYSRDKKWLGDLKEPYGSWEIGPEDFGYRELACLLPYVTATVKKIEFDAKDADAKLELGFDSKGKTEDEIINEVLEAMKQTYAKRSMLSRGPLVASDVLTKYGIDGVVIEQSPVPDIVNPAPDGADNPQGERLQLCENVIVMAGKGEKMLPVLKRMKENALKHIEMTNDGWYYDAEQLKAAKSFEELHDAIWRDIREHFRNVFNLKPQGSYVDGSGQLVQYGKGDRRQWIISYKTWNRPNDEDIKALFEKITGAEFGLVRITKRELERNAHVSRGVYTSKTDIADFFKDEELIEPKDLIELREGLRDVDIDSDDYSGLAMRIALLEILGGSEELDGTNVSFGISDHPLFDLEAQPEVEVEARAEAPAAEQLSRIEKAELSAGEEPECYVRDGKFDPLAAAWLLYNDYVFFGDNDIGWDGDRHYVERVQINSKKTDEIPLFMENIQEHVDRLVSFLKYIEDEQEFVVPRAMISPELYPVIREGDLTGITLFALSACGRALKIEGEHGEDLIGRERDFFTVTCDERIAMGIPSMQDLASLLAYKMRTYIDQPDCPQTVNVQVSRVRWADEYLGNVDERVEGADLEGNYCMQHEVGLKPDVTLPGDPEDPNTIHMDYTIDLNKLLEDMDEE